MTTPAESIVTEQRQCPSCLAQVQDGRYVFCSDDCYEKYFAPPMSAKAVAIPRTQVQAVAVLPWYALQVNDAFQRYQDARRALERARGELAVVRAVADGEFDDAGTYAVGSHGAWRVTDPDARYVLTDKGREAVSA